MVKVLGTTGDVTTCECCGRKDLKKTVAISVDDAEAVFYGTECAAQALKWGVKDVRKAAKKADDLRLKLEEASRAAAHQVEFDLFQTWLDAQQPTLKHERFLQLQAMGGYKVAREKYLSEMK